MNAGEHAMKEHWYILSRIQTDLSPFGKYFGDIEQEYKLILFFKPVIILAM